MTDAGRLAAALLAVTAVAAGAGCNIGSKLGADAARPVDRLVFGPHATRDDVVAHLNAKIERLHGWRCHNATIKTPQTPVSLKAKVSVKSPSGFRLRANSMLGDEADIGSNDERIWFWVRRSDRPAVYTVAHDRVADIGRRLELPFQSEWLMEVLGVVPIDPQTVTLQTEPGDEENLLQLVSTVRIPDGRDAMRLITVDRRNGYVISHQLYDARSHGVIAEAFLNDYRPDPSQGMALPHEIVLRWPEADQEMELKIGDVEINPAGEPRSTWELPRIASAPVVDLASAIR
ncbi:MAG: hypothetical protein AAF532_12140 [Planctomycetota bacterium]